MRFSSKFFLTLSASVALAGAALAGDGPEYKAALSGANEVPPVNTAASGEFKIEFDAKANSSYACPI
jgi:hypothetical protein